jgi:hypothetical protein
MRYKLKMKDGGINLMSEKVILFPHQQQALEVTCYKNKVAYYLDMGLGKTFVSTEKDIFETKKCEKTIKTSYLRGDYIGGNDIDYC